MMALLMGLKVISPSEVQQAIADHRVTVFDVNSLQSWETARVPGAIHLDPATFTERELPTDRGTSLVFYCSNPMCRKAPNAARRAKQMGYGAVQVMSAGITGWRSAQLPTEADQGATRSPHD